MKDMLEMRVRKVGNSLGLILPAEAARSLGVTAGDRLFLTHSPHGYRLTAYDPDFDRQVKAAKSVGKRFRNALRKLAQ
jgi:putative addiction module antidote